MTEPGVPPRELRLKPIDRISPSRFTAMRDCPLRGALESSGHDELLPKPPAARVGTIAHKLLEIALTSDPAKVTRASLEAQWDALVSEAEREMASNWMECHYVPLKRHVWRYAVRRIRAVKRSLEIASNRAPAPGQPTAAASGLASSELRVTSRDGAVGGFIDRVLPSPDGPILRDYKSGSPFDQDAEGATIRSAYATQLKLYAALYQATHDEWPVRLQVAPLRGELVDVPFTTGECSALLNEAISLRATVNEAILAGAANDTLASPAPQTCRFCQYRSACRPYRDACNQAHSSGGWPHDLWGTVEDRTNLEHGQLSLTLATASVLEPTVFIGPLAGPQRHPALAQSSVGDKLALFDLRPTKVEGHYRQGRSTIVYNENDAKLQQPEDEAQS